MWYFIILIVGVVALGVFAVLCVISRAFKRIADE